MQRLVVSTDNVPEAERFSYWREEICARLIGVSAERDKDQENPFTGRAVASIGAPFTHVQYRSDKHSVARWPRDVAGHGFDDTLALYREWSAGVRFNIDRFEYVARHDDLLMQDATTSFVAEAQAGYEHEIWFFPRKLLDPHLPASRRARMLMLSRSSGVAGMVRAYLNAFAAQIDALDEREAGIVADNFCRLLAVACGASAGEHQEALRLARLEEAKRYIGSHLADPGLTPEKAAAALKMSVRRLHLLFEPSGTSFAQYVLKRRLEECRAALMDTIGDRSVSDIALGWRFNSLWTFNRNFRQAFDVAPGELRARPAAGISPAPID